MNRPRKTKEEGREWAAGEDQGYRDSVANRPNRGKSYDSQQFRAGYEFGYELDQEARRLFPNERRD